MCKGEKVYFGCCFQHWIWEQARDPLGRKFIGYRRSMAPANWCDYARARGDYCYPARTMPSWPEYDPEASWEYLEGRYILTFDWPCTIFQGPDGRCPAQNLVLLRDSLGTLCIGSRRADRDACG